MYLERAHPVFLTTLVVLVLPKMSSFQDDIKLFLGTFQKAFKKKYGITPYFSGVDVFEKVIFLKNKNY